MNNTKHTPGPWSTYCPAKAAWIIKGADSRIYIARTDGANSSEKDEANARLIAAAPEMLEACFEALKHLEHSGDCKHDPDPTYDSSGHIRMGRMSCPVCTLERAIAKATGGAK